MREACFGVAGVGATVAVAEKGKPDKRHDSEGQRKPHQETHGANMSAAAVEVNTPMLKAVKCGCGRFLGAFIGRSQCPSCKKWVDVPTH